MKSGSKYDLRTFSSECSKAAFGEYSCYDEKNLAAQYEKRSLADITLCSVPDASEVEYRKSPSKRCDNGSSISLIFSASTIKASEVWKTRRVVSTRREVDRV
jgi:hypothetical protein